MCEEKPVLDDSKFQELVTKWEGELSVAYVDYKKKQDEIAAKAGNCSTLSIYLESMCDRQNNFKEFRKIWSFFWRKIIRLALIWVKRRN